MTSWTLADIEAAAAATPGYIDAGDPHPVVHLDGRTELGRLLPHLPGVRVTGDPDLFELGPIAVARVCDIGLAAGWAIHPDVTIPPGRRISPTGPVHIPGLVGQLRRPQLAAVEQLVEWRSSFFLDDVGLGKTVTSLAAASASGRRRIAVVSEKSLKPNWVNEVGQWFPGHWPTVTLKGVKPKGGELAGDLVAVLNNEILYAWTGPLIEWGCDCLLIDEGHYLASGDSRRTRATIELADAVRDAGGMVLLLTATMPPGGKLEEIWNGLRVLGARTAWCGGNWPRFAQQYGASRMRYGRIWFDPPTDPVYGPKVRAAQRALNVRLTDECMVRRTKFEVLPDLPAAELSKVVVASDPTIAARYAQAESDFAAWWSTSAATVAVRTGGSADWAARRAAGIANGDFGQAVRWTGLAQLAVAAKLEGVAVWIDQFLDRNLDEKLVVFANSRAVQHAFAGVPLPADDRPEHERIVSWTDPVFTGGIGAAAGVAQRWQPVRILADQPSDMVEAHKAQFQTDPECRLMVCSTRAAATGHTLTAAWTVVFVQPPSSPMLLRQCIGRVWGRLNDPHPAFVKVMLGDGPPTVETDLFDRVVGADVTLDMLQDGATTNTGVDEVDPVQLVLARHQ